MDGLRTDVAGSWGDQMRSYVLHPYQMVKDLRTEQETGNPSAVFDGEMDGFIEAGIRWRKQQQIGRRRCVTDRAGGARQSDLVRRARISMTTLAR